MASPANGDGATNAIADPTLRTLVSLAIFIHLFCVFAALTADYNRSELQGRLMAVFGPYTTSLNFDLDMKPYFLTHGTEIDQAHFFEIETFDAAGESHVTRLGEGLFRGGDPYQRYRTLGYVFAYNNVNDPNQIVCATLAQSLGRSEMLKHGARMAVFRCRMHRGMALADELSSERNPANPFDPAYYETIYEASLSLGDDGTVASIRIEEDGRPAPAVEGPQN